MPKKKNVCRIGYRSEDGIGEFYWEETPIGEVIPEVLEVFMPLSTVLIMKKNKRD